MQPYVPGLQLKTRVKSGELTPQEALNRLRAADGSVNTTPKENRTVRWLLARGATWHT